MIEEIIGKPLQEIDRTLIINQIMFIRWQELCCCDFESNGDSHSLSCLKRFITLVGNYKA